MSDQSQSRMNQYLRWIVQALCFIGIVACLNLMVYL